MIEATQPDGRAAPRKVRAAGEVPARAIGAPLFFPPSRVILRRSMLPSPHRAAERIALLALSLLTPRPRFVQGCEG